MIQYGGHSWMTCYMHGHVIRIASHTFDNIK